MVNFQKDCAHIESRAGSIVAALYSWLVVVIL